MVVGRLPLYTARVPVAQQGHRIPWSVMAGRRPLVQQTNEQNQLVVQVFLAILATILAIVSWFQVFG